MGSGEVDRVKTDKFQFIKFPTDFSPGRMGIGPPLPPVVAQTGSTALKIFENGRMCSQLIEK